MKKLGAILRPVMGSEDFLFSGGHLLKRLIAALVLTVCLSPGSWADEPPRRIVSLAPSITEILFALGLGDRVVGVTTFCDYPQEAKQKAKIGGMWNPSLEAIVSLKPDRVAVTTNGNHKDVEERLRSLGMRTYIFTARRLFELPRDIREAGRAFGVAQRGEALAREIEASLDRFRKQPPGAKKVNVLFIVWVDPLIAAGPETVIDDAITLLGARNVAEKARTPYPKYSIEEVIRQAPDIIVIGDMREGAQSASERLMKRLGMVQAVRDKKVFFVDDLYRLGPRMIRGIEELSRVIRSAS